VSQRKVVVTEVRSKSENRSSAVHGQRAHCGSGDDALIFLRELQHVLADCDNFPDPETLVDAISEGHAPEAAATQ
jgi:hypothetical protein